MMDEQSLNTVRFERDIKLVLNISFSRAEIKVEN